MSDSIEALVSRIDERTETMMKKLEDHCEWKAQASQDLAVLKEANLPERVTVLENWRYYLAGGLALLAFIIVGAIAFLKP